MTEERRKEIFMHWYHKFFKKEVYQGVGNFIIKLAYWDDWKSPNRKPIYEAFDVSSVCKTETMVVSNGKTWKHREFKNIALTPLRDYNDNSVAHDDGFSYLYDCFNRDPSMNCWIYLKEQAYDIAKDGNDKVIPYSYHGYPKMVELNAAFMIIYDYKDFASDYKNSEFKDVLVNCCGNTKKEIHDMAISPLWNTERTLEFYDALMNFSKEYLKNHKVQ